MYYSRFLYITDVFISYILDETGSKTFQTTNRLINMLIVLLGSVMHKNSDMKCVLSRCLLHNEIDQKRLFWCMVWLNGLVNTFLDV